MPETSVMSRCKGPILKYGHIIFPKCEFDTRNDPSTPYENPPLGEGDFIPQPQRTGKTHLFPIINSPNPIPTGLSIIPSISKYFHLPNPTPRPPKVQKKTEKEKIIYINNHPHPRTNPPSPFHSKSINNKKLGPCVLPMKVRNDTCILRKPPSKGILYHSPKGRRGSRYFKISSKIFKVNE